MEPFGEKSNGRPCLGPLREKCEECGHKFKCLGNHFTTIEYKKYYETFATYGKISRLVTDFYLPKVPATAWKLYCYLNAHCVWDSEDPNFGMCITSVDKISQGTGISKKHVYEHAQHLEQLGLVRRHRKQYGTKNVGYKSSIRYELTCYKRELALADHLSSKPAKVKRRVVVYQGDID